MYPKTKLAFLIMLLVLLACKSSHIHPKSMISDEDANNFYTTLIKAPTLPFTTFSVEKTPFRLDFKGQLRTLRATINCEVDSFAHITLVTSFGISVAEMYVTKSHIIFIDFQEKKGYSMDFNYLTQQLQFPFSFKDLQMLILGYPFLNPNQSNYVFSTSNPNLINYSFNIPCNIDSTQSFGKNFIFTLNTQKLVQGIYINPNNEERVNVNYTWSKKENHNLPKSFMLDLLYNDNQIGIDIEYKNAIYNVPLHFKRDSTVLIKTLKLDEKI